MEPVPEQPVQTEAEPEKRSPAEVLGGKRVLLAEDYEMNLEIIAHLEILQELGYPVLLGTSRKSVIGLTLDLPVDQREEGTMVTTVYGVQKGSAFVRVHDVEKNLRAIKMTKALMRM